MPIERPCKLCGERIRIIVNEHGQDFAIDARTRMACVLSEDGSRVKRYQHVHLAHAQTCTASAAANARGGSASASKTAPSPSQLKSAAPSNKEGS